jgi:hypothetical protein
MDPVTDVVVERARPRWGRLIKRILAIALAAVGAWSRPDAAVQR